MFQDVSNVQRIGVALFAAATAVWTAGLVRVMRRDRLRAEVRRRADRLRALPAQQGPPHAEAVQLTADERAAFAGLIRQFGGRRM
ncbi:hypothetical protein DCW30_34645 [Streptomyces alfalfae]|uniref:Uncharacterized protein n=1 Tax=Streptomyces alfalfae TaxID=1642299 RepID=A0ABN4VMR0_9ACTN|nr:hypothetical protein [Streptomyces alfalfae]APY87803.1 hypothetical protein A7J05_20665 [Streptomyces alfalfae]AYA18174.1 hypothetical protein D3X13_19750 [Streptomyces fradiae]RXX35344.1 hypothetical protein DCW30_34645 [Streptomyces alfalfae]RZM93620.1 hypothetical protein D4104_19125 [Streptomyces alfalfae]